MELKRIIARDSRAANEKAIQMYGQDVLIISSHKVDNQIELVITAAFFLYVGMGFLSLWMVILVVVRDVVVTALRVYAEFKNRPVVTSIEAKYKTLVQNIFVYIIMALILMKEASFSGANVAVMTSRFLVSGYLNYIMLAVTVFTVYTGISYLVSNWRIYLQKPLEGR